MSDLSGDDLHGVIRKNLRKGSQQSPVKSRTGKEVVERYDRRDPRKDRKDDEERYSRGDRRDPILIGTTAGPRQNAKTREPGPLGHGARHFVAPERPMVSAGILSRCRCGAKSPTGEEALGCLDTRGYRCRMLLTGTRPGWGG